MREIYEFRVSLASIILNREKIKKKLGADFMEEADRVRVKLSSIEAAGAFVTIDPAESVFQYGAIVGSAFLKAEKIALFVTTLGMESKRIINSYLEDPLTYYIADFLASEFAEGMSAYMYQRIKEYADRLGFVCSNRYSPGYCGWNVGEQGHLFRYFPENPCGIGLTDSFLMDPVKSVSGAVALGHEVKYEEYGCSECDEKNCLYKSKY